MGAKYDTELVGPKPSDFLFLTSEHDFHYILFAKSAQINFSRRILGESFQHTEKIAVHNSLQNDSHKNQVLGERQREAGQLLQTEVSFHQSSVSRAEKNSSCFIQNISPMPVSQALPLCVKSIINSFYPT